MIEEQALVVAVDGQEVTIAASRHSACGQCAAKSNCGQSAIAEWAASKMLNMIVKNSKNLAVKEGDSVIVGIDERSFINASLLLYLAPLIVMFAAGLIVTALGAVEWQVIVASFLALAWSFYSIKFLSKKLTNQANYQLVLLSIVTEKKFT